MYGSGTQAARDVEMPSPPIEPVSTVHENTLSILRDADNALSVLLSKVRGSQPEKAGELAKMPERHLLGDARAVRQLAISVFEKAQELHHYIGHDK